MPGRTFPLTEAQEGLWYFQRLDPANPILNTGQYLDLTGPLDVAAFTEAVRRMAAEAEPLRLRFAETADGPVQWLASDPPLPGCVDLSDETDPEAAALAAMRADSERPVDLGQGPLAAFTLYRLGPARFFWYQRVHHLATDGFGMVLMTNRVAELYVALTGGPAAGPALAPLALALEEDAAYRRGEKRSTDAGWWRAAMDGAPEAPSLAPGRTAPAARSFHRARCTVPPALFSRLTALAEKAGVTWPDALTALSAAYATRFAEAPETVVGVPFMGRLGSPAARVPGMVMNVLPLRAAPDEDRPLASSGFRIGATASPTASGEAHPGG